MVRMNKMSRVENNIFALPLPCATERARAGRPPPWTKILDDYVMVMDDGKMMMVEE
jgi:hypothetical protein